MKQRYHYNVANTRVDQHVEKGNDDGLYISSVACCHELWALIMDAGTGFSAQVGACGCLAGSIRLLCLISSLLQFTWLQLWHQRHAERWLPSPGVTHDRLSALQSYHVVSVLIMKETAVS